MQGMKKEKILPDGGKGLEERQKNGNCLNDSCKADKETEDFSGKHKKGFRLPSLGIIWAYNFGMWTMLLLLLVAKYIADSGM